MQPTKGQCCTFSSDDSSVVLCKEQGGPGSTYGWIDDINGFLLKNENYKSF
jgi:hypothetical protein